VAAEPQTIRDELAAAIPYEADLPVRIPYEFNYRQPDYVAVAKWRVDFLLRIRKKPGAVDDLCRFYQDNPVQFVADWGVTFDPRNVEIRLPSKIPFVPFPRQIAWMRWVLARWRARERGLTDKSRGSGASWMAVSLSATMCLFNRGLTVGFGSRTAPYVDELGNPKALFFKARMFLENLPPEFRFGWNLKKHSREMRLLFPQDSAMTGESGDGIGRGDRTSLYFVDEAAFLEHPELAESSLSDTTNCRIDISTPPVVVDDNTFVNNRERLNPRQVFTFHFRDDPRRDAEWEKKKRAEVAPEIFRREYDVDYSKGGAFFTEESLLVEGRPAEFPTMGIQAVFAVIDSALKTGQEHDGLAVTYFAICKMGTAAELTILDWDYTQIEGGMLVTWLPNVYQYLEALAAECRAYMGSAGAHIEDKVSGTVLLQQTQHQDWVTAHPNWVATAIDSKLTAMGKVERALNISGHVHQGKVKMSERAHSRVVNYKSVTKNHLLSQILSFRPGIKDQKKDDLLDTFTYGTALALGNSDGF
jgi:hypothetical protein